MENTQFELFSIIDSFECLFIHSLYDIDFSITLDKMEIYELSNIQYSFKMIIKETIIDNTQNCKTIYKY